MIVLPYTRPQITAAFSLLQDFSKAYHSVMQDKTMKDPKGFLHTYIAQFIPFGKPIDTNLLNFKAILNRPFPKETLIQTRPTYNMVEVKGKQKLAFLVREGIFGSIYNRESIPDACTATGIILCECDLEGFPEVFIELSKIFNLKNFTYHSCVVHPQIMNPESDFKVKFRPPVGYFTLCKYFIKNVQMPVNGYYKMEQVNDGEVKILLKLMLGSDEQILFDYCDVLIPFPNR